MELHALQPGYMLHEYRIEKKLGEGGFGITYLAIDTHLDMRVAIKEYLPSDFAMRQGEVTIAPKSLALKKGFDWGLNAFIDEAKTIAQFDAPNIVNIYRFFKGNGTAYIIMEFCEGGSLKQRIKAGVFNEQATRALLEGLIKGLQVMHKNCFFHRDIKPDNIMFRQNGTPVLIDFGAARQSVEGQTRTVTSMVTPGFAPPEQYSQNTKFGPWTDIYALAAVAYTCLKGRKPSDAVQRMVDDDYQPLGQSAQASGFLRGIDWGLQLSANQRPQNLTSWLSSWESRIIPDSETPPNAATPSSTISRPSDNDTVLLVSSVSQSSKAKIANQASHAYEGVNVKLISIVTSALSAVTKIAIQLSPAHERVKIKLMAIFISALVVLGIGFYGYQQYQAEQQLAQKLFREDVFAWSLARETDTEEGYQTYLVTMPKGRYTNQAKIAKDKFDKLNEQARLSKLRQVEQIIDAQMLLSQLAFKLNINGILDTPTKKAIEAFEKSEGLVITGIVDDMLISSLNQTINKIEQGNAKAKAKHLDE